MGSAWGETVPSRPWPHHSWAPLPTPLLVSALLFVSLSPAALRMAASSDELWRLAQVAPLLSSYSTLSSFPTTFDPTMCLCLPPAVRIMRLLSNLMYSFGNFHARSCRRRLDKNEIATRSSIGKSKLHHKSGSPSPRRLLLVVHFARITSNAKRAS